MEKSGIDSTAENKTEIKSQIIPIELQCALVCVGTTFFTAYVTMILFFKLGEETKFFWNAEYVVSVEIAALATLFSIPMGFLVSQLSKPLHAALSGFLYFIVCFGPWTKMIYCIIFNSLYSILSYHHPTLWILFQNPFSDDPFPGCGSSPESISPIIGIGQYVYSIAIFGMVGAFVGGIIAIYKRNRSIQERKTILPQCYLSELFFGFSFLSIIVACMTMLVRYPH
jgi:hypothetical protein